MALIDDPPAVEGPDLVVSRRLLADGIAAMDRGTSARRCGCCTGLWAALGLHVNPALACPVLAPASPSPVRTALAARILLSPAFAHHELGNQRPRCRPSTTPRPWRPRASTPRSGC